ncbi:unnamed protein product [Allacma fusca]|uniref:Uncharacterized protein n=1 Tax=Allacma fusca TaxID=39272 RepID=A0A8J2NII6_9HEXA|nr:unnamed protein product [Allacma fusca]
MEPQQFVQKTRTSRRVPDVIFDTFCRNLNIRSDTVITPLGAFNFIIRRMKCGSNYRSPAISSQFPIHFSLPCHIRTLLIPVIFDDTNTAYSEKEKRKGISYGHTAVAAVCLESQRMVYMDTTIGNPDYTLFRKLMQSRLMVYLRKLTKRKLTSCTHLLVESTKSGARTESRVVAAWVLQSIVNEPGSRASDWEKFTFPVFLAIKKEEATEENV